MAPKRVVVTTTSGRGRQQEGLFGSAWRELTASENATIVRSVLVFGVSICTFTYLFIFTRLGF